MQYRVDHFLPMAFEAIKKVKLEKQGFIDENGSIAKEYKGYISSLGANIVQAGVRAALTFYEAKETGSKSDRRLVNTAIKFILSKKELQIDEFSDFKLTELLKGDIQQKALEIMDAATALKLALRTYKMK